MRRNDGDVRAGGGGVKIGIFDPWVRSIRERITGWGEDSCVRNPNVSATVSGNAHGKFDVLIGQNSPKKGTVMGKFNHLGVVITGYPGIPLSVDGDRERVIENKTESLEILGQLQLSKGKFGDGVVAAVSSPNIALLIRCDPLRLREIGLRATPAAKFKWRAAGRNGLPP